MTAEWRYLAMINYEIDPAILLPYVPPGTEIDHWRGTTFVSIVGFLFLNVRVLGLPIPFHRNFDEINLRFYVRRQTVEGPRRGVVFVKEIVPRQAIATAARVFYNENYVAREMRVYGKQFVECLRVKPTSAFVAEGSPIIVRKGVRL